MGAHPGRGDVEGLAEERELVEAVRGAARLRAREAAHEARDVVALHAHGPQLCDERLHANPLKVTVRRWRRHLALTSFSCCALDSCVEQ